MSDKILTEAFDKLKAIEESDDPFCLDETAEEVVEEEVEALEEGDYNAERLFGTMDKIYDNLFQLQERLDHGMLAKQMLAMGFEGEQQALLFKLNDLMEEFDNILPGLEMQVRGE